MTRAWRLCIRRVVSVSAGQWWREDGRHRGPGWTDPEMADAGVMCQCF